MLYDEAAVAKGQRSNELTLALLHRSDNWLADDSNWAARTLHPIS